MTFTVDQDPALVPFPDHTQLPESDGTFVKNFQEHPQSILLTDSIEPVLQRMHPDGNYAIGQDCGIYWRITEPPEKGAVAPDWFYVPNVPPNLVNGVPRRSYVLWQEFIAPLIVLEFVSGNGQEERNKTPWKGKFFIYEQVIRPAFYGIYEVQKAAIGGLGMAAHKGWKKQEIDEKVISARLEVQRKFAEIARESEKNFKTKLKTFEEQFYGKIYNLVSEAKRKEEGEIAASSDIMKKLLAVEKKLEIVRRDLASMSR